MNGKRGLSQFHLFLYFGGGIEVSTDMFTLSDSKHHQGLKCNRVTEIFFYFKCIIYGELLIRHTVLNLCVVMRDAGRRRRHEE